MMIGRKSGGKYGGDDLEEIYTTKMINDSVIRSEIIILFSEGGFNFQNNIINYHGFVCCCFCFLSLSLSLSLFLLLYVKLNDYAVFHFSGNEESNLLQNKLPPGCYKYYPIPLTWLQKHTENYIAACWCMLNMMKKKKKEAGGRKQSSRAPEIDSFG